MASVRKGRKGFVSRPALERFWEKVDKRGDDECWPWLSTKASPDPSRAYGQFWLDGRQRRASQVAWEIHHGKPFPSGMLACHKCDNPCCVNPHHIFVGTMSDNLKDAVAKGRQVSIGKEKTHCPKNHPYDEANTRWTKEGYRDCIECKKEGLRRWRAKQKALAAAREPDRLTDEIADVRRRLSNARKRVAYWSGRPSARGFGFRPGKQKSLGPDEEYEKAMCDVASLSQRFYELTGEQPAVTDYQREFRDRFSKMQIARAALKEKP